MSKKILTILSVILIVAVSFTVGAYASGTGLLGGPWGSIESDVKDNTDDIIEGLEDALTAQVGEALNGTVEQETTRANREIDIYYNNILDGLDDNPKMNSLKGDLQDMTNSLIAGEKARINSAVEQILGQ